MRQTLESVYQRIVVPKEQAATCYLLRKKGMSVSQIAELVKLSKTTVYRRLQLAKTLPVSQGRWCNFQYRDYSSYNKQGEENA